LLYEGRKHQLEVDVIDSPSILMGLQISTLILRVWRASRFG